MANEHPFVATIRAVIVSPDEVEATVTAERLREACEELLDTEEGDEVHVTQVTDTATNLSPDETLAVLYRARNALIRTRIKECWTLARELDITCHWLGRRFNPGDTSDYDHGRILGITEAILHRREDPIS